MQEGKMMVALALLLLASSPRMLRAASLESSRADLGEPLQQQESAEATNQLEAAGSAESELEETPAEEGGPGGSAAQLEEQRWAEEGAGRQQEPGADQELLDSSIESAKVELGRQDLAVAAGYHHHHHHHGHHVHGKMSMGAHSGHKGAFGWHAKFPVGGKGRR